MVHYAVVAINLAVTVLINICTLDRFAVGIVNLLVEVE